jgi:hypothetical protein
VVVNFIVVLIFFVAVSIIGVAVSIIGAPISKYANEGRESNTQLEWRLHGQI